MKINPNATAFPFEFDEAQVTRFDFGLTVRAYFAAKAMQGMLANPYMGEREADEIAARAAKQADALIAELNKEPRND